MTLYIYKYNGTKYTKIAIGGEKIKEAIKNQLITTPLPKSPGSQGITADPETLLIDIKKMTHTVTVQGYLDDQAAVIDNASPTTTTSITATEAKNYIKKLILNGKGNTGLYWRGAVENQDYNNSNPTAANISNRVFWGEITTITFDDEIARMDMTQGEYEAIKGAYDTGSYGAYPGEVKRYRVSFDFVVGAKRIT